MEGLKDSAEGVADINLNPQVLDSQGVLDRILVGGTRCDMRIVGGGLDLGVGTVKSGVEIDDKLSRIS